MAFTIGKTEEELKAQRQRTIDEIHKRGGKASSPELTKRLSEIDGALNTIRTTPPPTNPPADPGTPGSPTTPPPTNPEPPSQPTVPPGGDNTSLPTPKGPENPPTNPFPQGSPSSDVIDPNTAGLTPEDQEAVKRAKAMMGVGETFGRKLADEFYATGSLGRQAETNTPEEIAALEQAKQFAATVGNQTDQIKSIIGQQQGILDKAQELSPLELEALGVSRDALQGLSAPEMEALRSAARANIQGQAQAALRDLSKSQARNQVFGAAASAQRAQVGQQTVQDSRNLERDLLIKDIDIRAAAKNDFTNLVTNTEANRAGRTNAASTTLSNTTLNDEQQRNSAKNAAVNNQGTIATTLAENLRKLREFNLNQLAAEKAGQVGSVLGGVGSITDLSSLLRGEGFADKQFQESKDTQAKILQIIQDSLKQGKSVL